MLPTTTISVIIPVYNVELFIIRCIQSVTHQTFEDYEVLVVDDCTPCNSISLIRREFAHLMGDKIKVLTHTKNGGLGAARNTGLREAKGEYVFFLDSDDWVEPTTLEKLYTKAVEKKADVTVADYYIATDEYAYAAQTLAGITSSTDVRRHLINYNPGAWNKLYKRSLFIENDIFFPEERQWYEDVATIPLILAKSKSVAALTEPLIFYYQRQDSIMGQGRKGNIKLFDIFRSANRLIENRRFFTREEWIGLEENLAFHCGAARLNDIFKISSLRSRIKQMRKLYDYLENTLPAWRTAVSFSGYPYNHKDQLAYYKKTYKAFASGKLTRALFWSTFIRDKSSFKQKILFVIPTLNIGGAEKVFCNLLHHLDRKKLDITVYVYEKGGPMEALLPKDNIRIIYHNPDHNRVYIQPFFKCMLDRKTPVSFKLFKLKTAFFNNVIGRSFTYNWLVRPHSDLPYSHFHVAAAYTELTPAMNDFLLNHVNAHKKIIWIHNFFSPACIDYIDDRLYAEYFRRFDSIIAVSTGAGDALVKRFPDIEGKISVINNIIDIKEILNKANQIPVITLDNKQVNMISVSRIDMYIKGYDRLIPVLKRLHNEGLRFSWYVVGDGPDLEKMKQMTSQAGLEHVVRYVGAQMNPYSIIKQADVLLLPSRFEAFPTVVLEAHILGVPCIVTKNAGTSDQFSKVKDMVLDNSDTALYEGLKKYLKDRTLQKSMKEELKDYEYNNAKNIQQHYRLFNIILSETSFQRSSIHSPKEESSKMLIPKQAAL